METSKETFGFDSESEEYEIRELTADEILCISGGQALYDRAPGD
ncbi:hypothetical protein P3T20_005091 [Paraburkholderia sp. GAS206C]